MDRGAEKLAAILGTSAANLQNALPPSAPPDFLLQAVSAVESKTKNFRRFWNIQETEAPALRRRLNREALLRDEKLRELFGPEPFNSAVQRAREAAGTQMGWFLKLEKARQILIERPPRGVLEFTGASSSEELIQKHEILEIFSALRFLESNEWMHETFASAYARLTPADFEEREIQIRVLGDNWLPVAKKFIAKKRHNVSHLKELGVIFLNPLAPETPGALLRDFALLFHYFREISFYSGLFKSIAGQPDFAARLASFLRGDILEKNSAAAGEWLIVQRYLDKENPADPRLLLPRANPEALHWRRAERDLAVFGRRHGLGLDSWEGMDSAAENINGEVISFDLEDVLMSAINFSAGENSHIYHQKEALWLELAVRLAGSEESLEKIFVDNFSVGVFKF